MLTGAARKTKGSARVHDPRKKQTSQKTKIQKQGAGCGQVPGASFCRLLAEQRNIAMLQTMAKPGPLIDTDDACWAAVLRRDAGADGRFFTCVKTTGIYCRPSCGAKRPKRENVFFVAT
ncbi:MAG TPA: Ada metal-binding domain-containing protein, partial [Pedomonas sp.]|nr:Ada metal-binding domain-containing protein [Pedomonas sp.]